MQMSKPIKGEEAFSAGLVDAITTTSDLLSTAK